jgi:hypothetical protein
VAVRVIAVPPVNEAEQLVFEPLQLMPDGLLVTDPLPVPAMSTVTLTLWAFASAAPPTVHASARAIGKISRRAVANVIACRPASDFVMIGALPPRLPTRTDMAPGATRCY